MPAEDTAELVELGETGYPFVVIEPAMPIDIGIPAVTVTNWGGAKMAAEYLIGLGHTHIGIITGPRDWRVSADRLAGYQAALLTAGLPILPRLVQEADFTIESGRYAAERLLSLPHAPSAIFAMEDAMAVGVLQAARAHGLHSPRDLSVIGFGDTSMAAITTPGLSSVQLPLQGLGRVGADMLWRLLQDRQLDAPRIELSTSLVVRESTAAPREHLSPRCNRRRLDMKATMSEETVAGVTCRARGRGWLPERCYPQPIYRGGVRWTNL